MRILHIEDEPSFADLFLRMLCETNASVDECVIEATLAGALNAAWAHEKGYFDAIVLDINLEDSRGMETVRKGVAPLNALGPVTICTGLSAESDEIAEAMKAGAVGFILKPWLGRGGPSFLISALTTSGINWRRQNA